MAPQLHQRTIVVTMLVALAMILSCSLPDRLLRSTQEGEVPVLPGGDTPKPEVPTALPEPAPEPRVVTHQGASFQIYSLAGELLETRPADGLPYPRPNTAQVAGESIYYVDSSGADRGGVVRRATSDGVETLDFTAAGVMASVTFAVSEDESRIAWTQSTFDAEGVTSELWIANLDGSDRRMVVQSDPADDVAEYFALEAVRWLPDGDLVYAWQVTGIGGYILFFGWSSFYRYSLEDGSSLPLVPASEEGAGPCWFALSPNGDRAVGGCGPEGVGERDLSTGVTTSFPVLPDQGQQGGAAYSPSGARLAYAIARGMYEDEAGQVLVRLSAAEAPVSIASQAGGYFSHVQWVDEDRMVVDVYGGETETVDLLEVDGTRTEVGDGYLIGLMRPGGR